MLIEPSENTTPVGNPELNTCILCKEQPGIVKNSIFPRAIWHQHSVICSPKVSIEVFFSLWQLIKTACLTAARLCISYRSNTSTVLRVCWKSLIQFGSQSEKSSNYDETQIGCLVFFFLPALLISLSLTQPSITKCSSDNYTPKWLKTPALGVRHHSLNDTSTHPRTF